MNNLQVKEQNLKAMMTNKVKALQALLGDQEKAKKFMAGALQVGLSKELAECTEESIINAVMSIAMLDLSVDRNAGEAYLIKYKNNIQLQVSYKGWKKLLYRAGYEIRTFPVFECDGFECNFNGWDYEFSLTPNFEQRDLGNFEWEYENFKGVLTVAKDLNNGSLTKDFYPKKVIEKSRLVSSTQKPNKFDSKEVSKRKNEKLPVGIWQDWYIEMCLKTGVKKIKNQLVLRDEKTIIANAIENVEFNNKEIDYKRTFEEGIVIEADLETKEPTQENKEIDLNSIQQVEKKPKTTQEILLEELLKADVPEEKALLMLNENTDKHEAWLKDKEDMHNTAMEYLC